MADGHAYRSAPRVGGASGRATGRCVEEEPAEARPVPSTRGTGGRPGILLDRDGTIIVDHGYVGSIDRVDFIEGAADAIASFNRAGMPVAVVTNQAGVARGFYGLDDVSDVHRHIA